MLTFFKKIFVWWNQDTFGTRIQTIFSGKLVGKDNFGNKYYENKKGKRWVIYSDENNQEPDKHNWQKPHQPNLTGTKKAYYPNKNNNEISKKYKTWKS